MIKVMTIFGTRPEAIKMAPIIKELKKRKEIECTVCVTAQHRQMLDQVLNTFKITPDYDLNIMKENQTLTDITNDVISGVDKIIERNRPDIILVLGGTTSAFAGALSAFYNRIDIGHIEAGLRTYDKYSPYPEEINRQMIDCMSDIYFAPTRLNKENLLNQNIEEDKIFVTGSTIVDTLKTTINKNYNNSILDFVKPDDKLILLTTHRRENIGDPMRNIFKAVKRITEDFPDVKVIYPIHKNPNIRNIVNDVFRSYKNFRLVEPLDVYNFQNLENKSYLILTDSNGVQEEASSLGKPVLVLRNNTERYEGVEAGNLKLVGTSPHTLYEEIKRLLMDKSAYEDMCNKANPYGDGHASELIVDAIIERYKEN